MTDRSETTAGTPNARGHEPTVLGGCTVAIWGSALAGLIAVAILVTWGLRQRLRSGAEKTVAPIVTTAPADEIPAAEIPPDPRQQATRMAYERQQQALLTEYGWVDRQGETARIPIERAMQIIVERSGKE